MEPEDHSGGILLQSNTEAPGENCEILPTIMEEPDGLEYYNHPNLNIPLNGMVNERYSATMGINEVPNFGSFRSQLKKPRRDFTQRSIHPCFGNFRRESQYSQYSYTGNQSNWNFSQTTGYDSSHQFEDMGNMNVLRKRNLSCAMESNDMQVKRLQYVICSAVTSLRKKEVDLGDDELHIYAEEGNSDTTSDLEAIIISEEGSFQDTLKDLGPKFHQLASICSPTQTQYSGYPVM